MFSSLIHATILTSNLRITRITISPTAITTGRIVGHINDKAIIAPANDMYVPKYEYNDQAKLDNESFDLLILSIVSHE